MRRIDIDPLRLVARNSTSGHDDVDMGMSIHLPGVKDLQAARTGSVAGSRASKELEEALWLIPIEDRRQLDSQREGMLIGFTLGNYLMLVEYTVCLLREGKASISSELTDIFERLGSSAALWQARLQKLRGGRGLGRFLSTSRERLREVAQKLGVHHLANLDGCSA